MVEGPNRVLAQVRALIWRDMRADLGTAYKGDVFGFVKVLDGRDITTPVNAKCKQWTTAVGIVIGGLNLGADATSIDRRKTVLRADIERVPERGAKRNLLIAELATIVDIGTASRSSGERVFDDTEPEPGTITIKVQCRNQPVRVVVAQKCHRAVIDIVTDSGWVRDVDFVIGRGRRLFVCVIQYVRAWPRRALLSQVFLL